MRTGLAGRADSALKFFVQAAEAARASGDRLLATAARRGQADVWLTLRACPDSAVRILREAIAGAEPGDRSSAEALVRVLAARGDVDGALAVLVTANTDTRESARAATSEHVAFLRGRATIERAEGHESAALSTLNEAIAAADRLHEGEPRDTRGVHAVGEVTRENAWLIFDIAQLRAHAKSPSIRSARESARLMGLLLGAWRVVDDLGVARAPTVRLGDRLILRAEQCRLDGTSCPVPVAPPSC